MSRKSRLVRLPEPVDRVLVSFALEHELNINEAVIEAIQRLGRPSQGGVPMFDKPAPPSTASEAPKRRPRPHIDPVVEAARATEPGDGASVTPIRCSHPRPFQRKLAYGVLCDKEQGGCGRLIRR